VGTAVLAWRANDGRLSPVAPYIPGSEAGAYQLTPYDPAFEKKMKKAGDIIARYRNTLRALSK